MHFNQHSVRVPGIQGIPIPFSSCPPQNTCSSVDMPILTEQDFMYSMYVSKESKRLLAFVLIKMSAGSFLNTSLVH